MIFEDKLENKLVGKKVAQYRTNHKCDQQDIYVSSIDRPNICSTEAPRTLRMPISLLRLSIFNEVCANKHDAERIRVTMARRMQLT